MTITKIVDDDESVSYLGTEYHSELGKALFPNSEDFYDRHNQSFLS